MSHLFDESFRRRLEVLKRIVARALAGRGGGSRAPIAERGGRVEFAEHRGYVAGDDPRTIDWAAYARLETLVVKEFEAPREAHMLLVVDRSASMRLFDKESAALRLVAALGWLGLAAGARVAFATATGASRWVTGPESFPELLALLDRDDDGGDFVEALRRAPAAGSGRRTTIFVGDLYEPKPLEQALVACGRAERMCVHVVSPNELQAPAVPAARIRDAETGEEQEFEITADVRTRFRAAATAFLEDRSRLVQRHGARYARIDPAHDLIAAVEETLLGRRVS